MADLIGLGIKKHRTYKTTRHERRLAQARRDAATAIRHCINENSRLTHGPATHGVRCQACYETHRKSA